MRGAGLEEPALLGRGGHLRQGSRDRCHSLHGTARCGLGMFKDGTNGANVAGPGSSIWPDTGSGSSAAVNLGLTLPPDFCGGGNWGSPSAGGVQYAFCDGSVRVVPNATSPMILGLLADRADGQIIPDF